MKTEEKLKILNTMTPEKLLESFGMDNQIPVDIIGLIKSLGIKIIPYDFSKMEQSAEYFENVLTKGYILGATASTEDVIGIFYKHDDPINRVRFTLAHELAHCCLHMTPQNFYSHIDYRTNEIATKGIEYEANVFAGKILIPEKELRYAQKNLIVPYLSSLAKIFGVSETVMKARLNMLKLEYKEDELVYG